MTVASTLAPRKDTVRLVEWDELPASVKQIPLGLNPIAEGVLMLHQQQWCALQVDFKVGEKGRRTGITFAEALDDTLIAASKKEAGGDNVYYIADTKDKGLEFIGYCAHFARVIAQAQGQGVSSIEEFIFDDQQEDGTTRQIAAYRIRFSSGFTIAALSSRPANIRGLQGIVVIDEAAFHQNVQAVIEAATALLIWGGKIRVISTHNGRSNAFNTLIDDIKKGRYGKDAAVYRATFDDAVRNGLYERVCLMNGWEPTAEGKKAWYTKIRNLYGPRKAAMREELDAIPRDGGGIAIPGVWIDRAMPDVRPARPVLRLVLDDDFARKEVSEREAFCEAWIRANLVPALELLAPPLQKTFGMDFARHRHFSVITPIELMQSMRRHAPFVIELNNVPSRQQEQILDALIKGFGPMFRSGAIDASGPGLVFAEYAADKHGHSRIHQVTLSLKWYAENMPKMLQRFEDGSYVLPRDASLEEDLRSVEYIDGIPHVTALEAKDLKEPELVRHGDFAISLALGEFATLNMGAPMEYMSSGQRESVSDARDFLYG